MASVRVSGLMRDNRPSFFSEILQQVVFSYLVVHYKTFFFKQKTAYEIGSGLVGSEMCIRDRLRISPKF